MAFWTLRLAGSALIAAAFLAPTAASAQYAYGTPQSYPGPVYAGGPARDRAGYPRAGTDRDGYARETYYEDRPPPPPPPRRGYRGRDRCDHGSAGTILGAIAGGLLGNAAIGRHGNHTAGALAGAGAGALIGNAADRDCN